MLKKGAKPWHIVIGLGNPGPEYRNTYHNVGITALRAIATELQKEQGTAPDWHNTKLFRYAKCGALVLAEPTTFMNDSGKAAVAILRRFRETTDRILVLHDDSDIVTGSFKLAAGRGAAGHRGVQSILDALKTKNFWRGRIGVRSRRGKAGGVVPRAMNTEDKELIYCAIGELTKKVIAND